MLDAALALVTRGWYVFPLSPRSKVPWPGSRGLLEATLDPAVVRTWWSAVPDANIGLALAPSGLMAIDADGADWRAKVAALEGTLGPLPRTLVQMSGGGVGIHALYRAPPWPVKGTIGGITLRGRNYLVVAPSVHPNGGVYRWPDLGADVAELPAAWLEAVRQRADVDTAEVPDDSEEEGWLRAIDAEARLAAARLHLEHEDGERMAVSRHGMTYDVCRSITRGYAVRDAGAAFDLLVEVYNPKCVPPWPEHRLARLVENAYDAALPEWGHLLRPRDAATVLGFDPSAGTPAPPAASPPTALALGTTLRAAATRAGRSTRPGKQEEAEILRRVVGGKALYEPGEDADAALDRAAITVLAHAPRGTTDAQVAGVLARSAGQTGAERLSEIVAAARAIFNTPQSTDGEDFTLETMGLRAGQPAPSQGNIALALRKLGVQLRHDLLADAVTTTRGGLEARADDGNLTSLFLEIEREFAFRPSKEYFFDVVGDIARAAAYHPVCDYLDGLAWDGVPRIDGWLTAYAGADDTPYVRAVGALVLVAAVRRVRSPGAKFDEMLVLEAPQGTEKSSALRVLTIRDEWFGDELPLGGDTKRQIEAISGKWLVEAGELSGLHKSEEADLKAFLSRQCDEARMAYARMTKQVLRQCIIVGTTNESTYLRDPTGNRRWWPVRILSFDLERLRADRDQLWAEASAREAAGASVRLARHLWADAEREQEDRRVDDPYLEPLDAVLHSKQGKLRIADAWRIVRVEPTEATPEQQRRLTGSMRVLGWERSRRRGEDGVRGYFYVKGDSEKVIDMRGVAGARPT